MVPRATLLARWTHAASSRRCGAPPLCDTFTSGGRLSQLDLNLEYDEGFFSRDAEGWCTRAVRLTQEAAGLRLREWGDDNGQNAYERSRAGTVESTFPELGLVRLGGDLAGLYVDLVQRRVRQQTEPVHLPLPAEADPLSEEAVRRAIDRARRVLCALAGQDPPPEVAPPPALTWPDASPSPTASGCVEAQILIDLPEGQVQLTRRSRPDGQGETLFLTRGGFPSLTLTSSIDGQRLFFRGPLERRAQALQAVEGSPHP